MANAAIVSSKSKEPFQQTVVPTSIPRVILLLHEYASLLLFPEPVQTVMINRHVLISVAAPNASHMLVGIPRETTTGAIIGGKEISSHLSRL